MPKGSPHDALFKSVFSDPREAASLLRSQLPARIAAAVDWRTLRIVRGTFVDEALRNRHTDLLFTCRLRGAPALLYLLIEHQSTGDPWMALRMLRYVVRVWDRRRELEPAATRLPVVIPVVLYHGEEGWRAPTEVLDLVEVPPTVRDDVEALVPRLSFVLDDVSGISNASLAKRSLSVFADLAVRALARLRGHPAPIDEIRQWLPLLTRLLRRRSGLRRLRVLLEYVHRVAAPELDEVRAVVRQLGPGAEEVHVTLAETLIEEGHKRGLEKGTALGATKIVSRLLTRRFGPLSDEVQARLEAATIEELERWGERAVDAEHLDDVFA